MRSRNELAHALTELPNELLLEAENAGRRRKPVKFHRIAAVAAIVAMLAVTVGAAAVGINWKIEPEQNTTEGYAQDYYKDYDGVLDFEKLEYTIPLEVVELPEKHNRELWNVLYRHWNLMQREDYRHTHDYTPEYLFEYNSSDVDFYMNHFLTVYGTGLEYEPGFTTIEEVEELLGMELAVSQELREALRRETGSSTPYSLTVRIKTGLTMAEAGELVHEAPLEPTEIIINFQLDRFCGNGRITGAIVIPLMEETAQEGIQGLHYSYEKEGTIWQEEQTVAGRNVTLFGNDPETGYDGWSEAVYTQDGIGYCIGARKESDDPGRSYPKPYYDSAKEMVLALMEDDT